MRLNDAPARATPNQAIAPAIGGLIALAAGMGIGRFVYTPILPAMIAALGLSKSQAGLMASANFAGYFAGALFASTPWLLGSRQRWLLAALAISAVSTAGMGMAATAAAFLALRFIGGAASALVLILASALVLERLAQAGRGGLSPVHFAGVGAGIAVSAVIVAVLQALGQDWRSLWLASGAASLAATIAVALLIPNRPEPRRQTASPPPARLPPRLAWFIGAYGLFGFGYVITATFLVTIVRATPAIQPLEPYIWIAVGFAAAPSVMLWTRVSRAIGLPSAFALACLAQAAGVLASVVWPSTAGLLLAAILVGGTFMGQTALGLMHARALAVGDPRRVLALMTLAFSLGQIIGPAYAGMVYDALGSLTVPSCTAAAALVAAAILARR